MPVTTGAAATAVPVMIVKLPKPVPLALMAVTGTLVVPEAVGVPEIRPVPAFRVSPEGRLVAV